MFGGRRRRVCGEEWEELFHVKYWKKDERGNGLSSLNWESFWDKMKNMDRMFHVKHWKKDGGADNLSSLN